MIVKEIYTDYTKRPSSGELFVDYLNKSVKQQKESIKKTVAKKQKNTDDNLGKHIDFYA